MENEFTEFSESENDDFEIEIENGTVDMVELGWQEISINHKGENYIIELTSEESPNKGSSGSTINFYFNDDESEKIAKQIGFVIKEHENEIYRLWDNYSNNNFRG